MGEPHEAHSPAGERVGHVVPVHLTVGVGAFLLVMTVITVYTATQIDLGSLNLWIALVIAFAKGSAVCLYFMHLRWDSPFNAIVLIAALLFVVLFIGIALTDTSEYQPEIFDWRESGNVINRP